MKEPILTAEEFLREYENKRPLLKSLVSTVEDRNQFYSSAQGTMITIDVMVEYAKIQVKAALEAASNKTSYGFLVRPLFDEYQREAILNAYPESNIK